ncbi:MAG: hypothetical protein ACREJO_17445 [Phycisphaerales bacterium]
MSFASHEIDEVPAQTARSRGKLILRVMGWAFKGTAAVLVLASLKCIVLYMVLPALAINWFSSSPAAGSAAGQESKYGAAMSAGGGDRQATDGDRGAAVGTTQDPDASPAR